jgi:hypothetical protein
MKTEVNRFMNLKGVRIPACPVSARYVPVSMEAKPIPALEYHVQLKGAKEPYNMFLILLTDQGGFCAHLY